MSRPRRALGYSGRGNRRGSVTIPPVRRMSCSPAPVGHFQRRRRRDDLKGSRLGGLRTRPKIDRRCPVCNANAAPPQAPVDRHSPWGPDRARYGRRRRSGQDARITQGHHRKRATGDREDRPSRRKGHVPAHDALRQPDWPVRGPTENRGPSERLGPVRHAIPTSDRPPPWRSLSRAPDRIRLRVPESPGPRFGKIAPPPDLLPEKDAFEPATPTQRSQRTGHAPERQDCRNP